VDVLDEASVAAAFAMAPPPQAVVNLIGGYTPPQPLSELDIDVLRTQLELNLVTAATVTKHAMPVLAAQSGGAIVLVSSRVATEKGENGFAYSVSKLGVLRLVEAAAAEGRELRVRVNCILPSVIDTPANRAAMPRAHHDRWPKPSELAAVLAFLVSDDATIISGAAIPVYGRA
jgi:NAD(P)-dependent dehydrogenase (short-subunit alcohol dehydrogenase family)